MSGADAGVDLFVAGSPLQVLNALEARHRFGIPAERAVLLLLPLQYREGDLDQLRALVEEGDWRGVRWVSARGGGHGARAGGQRPLPARLAAFRRFAREATRAARGWGPVGRVFLGHYGDKWMRHVALSSGARETVLLDDGMATLTVAERRLAGAGPEAAHARRLRARLARGVKERVFGARFDEIPRVTFFTAFDIRVRPGDAVVANPYARVRGRLAAGEAEGVLFLGMPLVELGLVREAVYLEALRRARAHYGAEPVAYAPHRAEDPARLEAVCAAAGMTPRPLGLPVEWALANGAGHPRVLASFYSSGLESCRRIFGDRLEVAAFRLPPESILDAGVRATVDGVYDYLARGGVEVVPVSVEAEAR